MRLRLKKYTEEIQQAKFHAGFFSTTTPTPPPPPATVDCEHQWYTPGCLGKEHLLQTGCEVGRGRLSGAGSGRCEVSALPAAAQWDPRPRCRGGVPARRTSLPACGAAAPQGVRPFPALGHQGRSPN